MLIQYTVDNPTLPVNMFFQPHPVPGGMLISSLGMPSCREEPPSIWDTHGISGNVFVKPAASSSAAPYPQELNPWSSHMRGQMETKHQFKIRDASPDRQRKVQSSLAREILQRADQQRLQFSDLHFGKFNIEVCTFSQFPTEAMQWIKEVETVDSVCSVRGIQTPNFYRIRSMRGLFQH